MTIGSKAIAALREGRALTGYFMPRRLEPEVPGVLSWSFEDGAGLELIGDTSAWPRMGLHTSSSARFATVAAFLYCRPGSRPWR
jgi:hypothetical protein